MRKVHQLISRLTGLSRGSAVTSSDDVPDPTTNPPSLDHVDPRLAERLLPDIEAIDWASLEHAYGPATTTPTYLRALLSTDAKVRDEAVEHLWSAVTHQGTVYSATVAATPFLVRILGDEPGREIRATLLAVLEVVAGGTSYHDVHGQFFSAEERATPEWEEQLGRELTDVAGCRREAANALDLVISLLDDPVEDVRLQATSTAASNGSLDNVPVEGRAKAIAALEQVATGTRAEPFGGWDCPTRPTASERSSEPGASRPASFATGPTHGQVSCRVLRSMRLSTSRTGVKLASTESVGLRSLAARA